MRCSLTKEVGGDEHLRERSVGSEALIKAKECPLDMPNGGHQWPSVTLISLSAQVCGRGGEGRGQEAEGKARSQGKAMDSVRRGYPFKMLGYFRRREGHRVCGIC